MDSLEPTPAFNPSATPRTRPGLGTGPGIDQVSRVVWAMDAFPDQAHLQIVTATAIERLFPEASIYPVYVMSEESFSDRGFSGFLRPALKPMAEKAMASFLKELDPEKFERPRVLLQRSSSQPAAAKKLGRFAKRIGADVIALGSHGRKGLTRFILGSFSEALLTTHTGVPVLLTGPRAEEPPAPPEVIVFPTDFSEACEEAFDQVLELARAYDAEVHLFHKAVHYVDPFIQSGVHLLGGGWVSFENFMDLGPDSHEADADHWVSRAAATGVQVRYVCENFREPISEAIVEYAGHLQRTTKRGSQGSRESNDREPQHDRMASVLITMVPQSGPVASALLGSTTRDVIRLSPCPLYLMPRP